MPIGKLKNTVYGAALPLIGKRCEWKAGDPAGRVLHRLHTVGACVQRFEKGDLTDLLVCGYASLKEEKRPVTPDTLFRTASIAKMVTALLVFRLQTLGKLSIQEDISALWGAPIRNPHCPEAPITLGMLLSHTSGIVDSPAYFAAFEQSTPLSALLGDVQSYHPAVPGMHFQYSNFAAGLVACLLEKRFGESFETLMQRELFVPLGVKATFDLTQTKSGMVADSYRVLPESLAFDAAVRCAAAASQTFPDPEQHYLPAAGNLYITATQLARLALVACTGHDGFLNADSLACMQRPLAGWPEQAVRMRHGMGLLMMDDNAVCSRPVWGHQGFAYGAVNGVFFDAEGTGFVLLNSGVSEQRVGHLALVNRDLLRLWMK